MEKEDNLEILYLKCPYCNEVTRTDQWVTMALTTTSCSASFSFGSKPKNSNSLMCPRCRKECHYLEIVEAMMKEKGN